MEIKPLSHPAFRQYGQVLERLNCAELLRVLRAHTPKPEGETVYLPSDPRLEALEAADVLRDHIYGGMDIQVGYCNGSNQALNCLEYHRGSEVNIAADDIVLLLAPLREVREHRLDTARVEAFLVPAGGAVLLYETTLHYAPCGIPGSDGFRVAVVLPRGTNTQKPSVAPLGEEDPLLWAKNKWLLAHPQSPEATLGAFPGLTGPNLRF